MQCLSPKSTGFNEFSSNIATALVCLGTNRTYNFSKMIFDGMVKNVNNKVSKFLVSKVFNKMFKDESIRSNNTYSSGEGSGTPTKPHYTPSPEAQPSSHTHISSPSIPTVTSVPTIPIPIVIPSDITPIRQYTRRARIAQSSVLPPVADEPASPVRDDSQWEAYPTDYGFIADQDRATIAKSSTLPYDSAPRVTSPVAEEGSMQQSINELTALCTSLQRKHSELLAKFQAQEVEINRLMERVKILEDKGGVVGDSSGYDAPIKGKRIDEEEVATERVSSDTKEVRLDKREVAAERAREDIEEIETVLTTIDAATVLASGTAEVPTGSGSIPTAGPPPAKVPTGSDVVPTASPVFATATVIDAQIAKDLKEQLGKEDQRRAEQIARDAEIARIHAKEELQKLLMEKRIELISDLVKYQDNYTKVYKFQSQQRKSWTKKQKRDYYIAVIRNNLGWKVKDFKGIIFEEVEAKFNSVCKQMEDFTPMGSKEEAERIKRKGINLEQESAKKQKSSKDITEEIKFSDEVPKEKIKEMMQLVPIEEVYVEALQVKHPIIDWDVYTEGQRAYWKITRLGGSSASYQFFTNLLKHLDRDDLNQLWSLVKETLSKRPATNDKEMELWVDDSAPRVTSTTTEEGSMQQTLNELTDLCTSLQRQHLELLAKFQAQEVEINRLKERVKNLEDKEGVIGDKSEADAPIKGKRSNEGEAAAEKISTDSEKIARVLTSLDATNVLAGETNVPTGSGS
nr:leucine-rich repeat protein [Tanacetum cinerariifolium]